MLTAVRSSHKPVPGPIAQLVRFPLQRIHVELTNVCNFDCTFCPKQEMTRKYEYMDHDRVIGIIDQVAEYNLAEKITFHVMGEPFMHPRFFDILDYAHRRGVGTGITTNGTYLDGKAAERLESVKATQINISLQTPDEESFKTRKARKMDFDQYKEKILEFIGHCLSQQNPPKIKVHFLNTKFTSEVPGEDWTLGTMNVLDNTQDLQRTFTYWADAVHALYPRNGGLEKVRDKIKKLSVFKWNVVEVLPNLYFETYILDTWGNAFVGDNVVPSRIGYCSALTDHFAILTNGDLTYCCKDYNGETAGAGNVFETPIVEILNSDRITKVIEGFRDFKVVDPYCQKCLGGSTWLKSVGNQLGSIIIWKYLKGFFYKKT